jgi:hypothetical protein
VNPDLYKRTLEDAKAEMGELLQQRRVIEQRIAVLAPVIEYLSPLCDQLPHVPSDLPMPSQLDMGLSDAIRLAFKSVLPASLTPMEVRDKLKESGFNLDKYASELPPIHNTIMRLLKQGEIEEDVPRREGKAYKWVSSLKRALLDMEPLGRLSDMASPPTREQVKAAATRETWISRATGNRLLKDMG